MHKKANDRYIRKMAKKKRLVDSFGGKCTSCGESRLHLLSFHHIDPGHKIFSIGSRDHRISDIFEEGRKCKLLCYNCHMELHYGEYNKQPRRIAYKKLMLDYLKTTKCSACGYSKCLACLEFHHVDSSDKIFQLSKMKGFSKGLPNNVKDELDKCVVLCSNCHHDIHFNITRFAENNESIITKSKNIKEINKKIDRDVVYDMYVNRKMKQIDIAKHFNSSKGTINNILKPFGLTNKLEDLKLNRDEILKLHSDGLTCSEIAASINQQRLSVRNIIITAGLKPNLLNHRKPVVYRTA
jgi:hypothetical protein